MTTTTTKRNECVRQTTRRYIRPRGYKQLRLGPVQYSSLILFFYNSLIEKRRPSLFSYVRIATKINRPKMTIIFNGYQVVSKRSFKLDPKVLMTTPCKQDLRFEIVQRALSCYRDIVSRPGPSFQFFFLEKCVRF